MNKRIIIFAALFILSTSLASCQVNTGYIGEDRDYVRPVQIISEPNDFVNSSEISKVYSSLKEYIEKEFPERNVPPTYIKLYENPEDYSIGNLFSKYNTAAERIDFDGIVIFYFKGSGFIGKGHTDKVSKKELEVILKDSMTKLTGGSSYSEVLEFISKEIVRKSSSETGSGTGKGEKDLEKFSERGAFLISDKRWKRTLSLVPLTTWTKDVTSDKKCQRGYGTPKDVCAYPTLIYHEEPGKPTKKAKFDADSIIYFLQQYSPSEVTVIGESPKRLNNLLITNPGLGAGLKKSQVKKIGVDDYFSYWKSFDRIVYVEESYEKALMASTYASLLNVPLIVENSDLDSDKVFKNRKIICVGDTGRDCDKEYNVNELQESYVEKTGTDKLILVNPNDLRREKKPLSSVPFYCPGLSPDKSSGCIKDVYTKNSLAAPILAGAKHEVIIITPNSDYREVNQLVENKVIDLFELAKEEPDVSLNHLREEKSFTFFEPKKEAFNFTFTSQWRSGFDINEIGSNIDEVRSIGGNILTDSNESTCKVTMALDIGMGKGPEKRIEVDVKNSSRFPLNRLDFYGSDLSKVIKRLPTEKDKFNLIIKPGTCGRLLVLKDAIMGDDFEERLRLSLDKEKHPSDEAYVESISGHKEIKRKSRGLKGESEVSSVVDVDNDFNYKFNELLDRISYFKGSKELLDDGSMRIKLKNDYQHFNHIKKIILKPVLKDKITLTILGHSKDIDLSKNTLENPTLKERIRGIFIKPRTALDPMYYADLYNNRFKDMKVGRLAGITLSDVSAYLGRDLFYDKLPQSEQALVMVKGIGINKADELKKDFNDIKGIDKVKAEFDKVVSCYGYDDSELGCDTYSSKMRQAYMDSGSVVHLGHGTKQSLKGIIKSSQLGYLKPSIQLSLACGACDFDDGTGIHLFCANNIRKGSLGFVGQAGLGSGHFNFERLWPKLYLEEKSLGTAFDEMFSDSKYLTFYTLGDPTFKVKE